MKTLVAFYSRTGTTKKVGETITQKLQADAEEIKDTANRSGAKGYLLSGFEGMKRKLTTLQPIIHNPADYDLVIIGTPIWSRNISSPVRTYITENKDKFKKVAFFRTMGGTGDNRSFLEMEKVIGQKPLATFSARTVEVIKNNYEGKLEEFLASVRQ